jgi:mono/diheme cytochrome c family protein
VKALRVVSLMAVLAITGCDPPQPAADQYPITLAELEKAPPPSDPGEAAYRRTCIACHGADGRGNDAKTGANLTAKDGALTQSDDVLHASVRDGKKGNIGVMPPHKGLLTEEEIGAVVRYVRRTYGAGIVPAAAAVSPLHPTWIEVSSAW